MSLMLMQTGFMTPFSWRAHLAFHLVVIIVPAMFLSIYPPVNVSSREREVAGQSEVSGNPASGSANEKTPAEKRLGKESMYAE
jgi:hypothetical protein